MVDRVEGRVKENFWLNQLPAFAWAAMIFLLSSFPTYRFPRVEIPGADKMVHVGLFFGLAFFTERALRLQNRVLPWAERSILLAVVLSFLYGLLDETHQMFVPTRAPDIVDAAADLGGGLLFALVAFAFRSSRKQTAS